MSQALHWAIKKESFNRQHEKNHIRKCSREPDHFAGGLYTFEHAQIADNEDQRQAKCVDKNQRAQVLHACVACEIIELIA